MHRFLFWSHDTTVDHLASCHQRTFGGGREKAFDAAWEYAAKRNLIFDDLLTNKQCAKFYK